MHHPNRPLAIALAALLVVLALTAGATLTGPRTETDIAAKFCAGRGDDARIYRLLTPAAQQEWDAASAHNDAIARARPDEKPPLGDGMPTSAFPDHAPACQPGPIHNTAGRHSIDIEYRFPDDPKANWTDRLILVQARNQRWQIDDILFPPTGAYGLRRTLQEVITNNPLPPTPVVAPAPEIK